MSEYEDRTAYVALASRSANGQTKLYVSGAYWSRDKAEEHVGLFERLRTCDPYIAEIAVDVPVGNDLVDSNQALDRI